MAREDIVRVLKRLMPDTDFDGVNLDDPDGDMPPLEKGTLLTVTTVTSIGIFDAITLSKPIICYVGLFPDDDCFEVLNEMEALALAAQEEEE